MYIVCGKENFQYQTKQKLCHNTDDGQTPEVMKGLVHGQLPHLASLLVTTPSLGLICMVVSLLKELKDEK